MKHVTVALLVAASIALPHVTAAQDKVTLVMGSWRTEDIEQWNRILDVFHAAHPNIEVSFQPTLNTEYVASLRTQLQAKAGPDIISCFPFDNALADYEMGGLSDISGLPGLENFPAAALAAWTTDDGKATYCVPVASVIHGFIYNKTMFDKHGISVPKTESDFFAALDALKAAGETGLAIGTKDAWTSFQLGFNNVWGNYCDGEESRQQLIGGTAKFTDECVIKALDSVARWQSYLPEGHQSIGYGDAQQLFLLGRGAIYPSGSWEIPLFMAEADFELGAFQPYVPDDRADGKCWINDHVDMAIGMNANTAHPEEARTFLEWLTTPEFAQVFITNQPGFFPLATHAVSSDNPLAAEFASWRQECGSTIRVADQYLSRGNPAANQLLDDNVYLMVRGEIEPAAVGQSVQAGLDSWYKPPVR
jgi:raffinose/stachyose/melibiose transport system substrate-binding protein